MSANLAAGQLIETNLLGVYDGQRCINTFAWWITSVGAPPTKTVNDLLQQVEFKLWDDGAGKGLTMILTPTVSDVRLTGQIIMGPGARSVLEVRVPNFPNGQGPAAGPLPSGASACISRKGGLAGRPYQGRFYLFGIDKSYVTKSELNDLFVTDYLVTCGQILDPITMGVPANNFTATACLHAVNALPTPGQIGLTTEIHRPIRYQRRREVGVGQ